MFNKHEFTCPDVIFLRKRAKRNALIQIGLVAGLAVTASVAGWWTERQEAQAAKNTTDPTTEV